MPRKPMNIKTVKESLNTIEKTLKENPELRERTENFFAGRLKGAPLIERDKKALNLKVDKEIIERAEALIPRLKADPELSALGRISVSSIIRLAILRGIEVLEKQYNETLSK